MAVKVMWARAIREEKTSTPQANGLAAAPPSSPLATAAAPKTEKPKRRRSSVYDADGNEVFITLACLKCHKMRPLSQFGLRRMADGAIRNQPWCKACRSDAAKSPRRQAGGAAETGESSVLEEPTPLPIAEGPSVAPANENLAAQIAAALNAGRR